MTTTKLKFSHGYIDSVGGKDEYCCNGVLPNGDSVGYCKYYSTDPTTNIVYIEYIYINADQRRKGYATQFVEELQRAHTLDWNYSFTNEGRKWYDALVKRKIVALFHD